MKLNSAIYNSLVKVFNDAANDPVNKDIRSEIIDARKRFPTFNELLKMDLDFNLKQVNMNPTVKMYKEDTLSGEGFIDGFKAEFEGTIINLRLIKFNNKPVIIGVIYE